MMKRFKIEKFFFLFLVVVLSCKKESTPLAGNDIISFVISNSTGNDVDRNKRTITIYMDESIDKTKLTAAFQLSPGANLYYNEDLVKSSESQINYSQPAIFTVKAQNGTSSLWTISVVSNYEQIGLGKVIASKSVKLLYDWYVDQGSGGSTSLNDGGAACLAMSLKWADVTSSIDISTARSLVDSERNSHPTEQELEGGIRPLNGSPLTTLDVGRGLKSKNSKFVFLKLSDISSQLIEIIDKGYIAILCVDMDKIRYNYNPVQRIEKWYETNFTYGHFVIVKGYKSLANGSHYFEVYDPLSLGNKYKDTGVLKGVDRYYHSSYLGEAIKAYWNFAIVVGQKSLTMEPITNTLDMLDESIPMVDGR